MLRPRIIPCLLVSNKGLVKTRQFAEPKYVGDPINAVKIFNEKGVDELMVLDIDASTANRAPDYSMIESLASECRMPLCYGGGVKTAEQAKRIFGLGVEKVAISSAAVEDPEIVTRIAEQVGSQSVVAVLDVKMNPTSREYEIWTRNGKTRTGRNPVEFARNLESLGAGEIVVNSIDRDGMLNGYDLALLRKVRESIPLPLTALGGAGALSHFEALFADLGVVGAAAGSFFVFKGPYRAVLISYPSLADKERCWVQASGS